MSKISLNDLAIIQPSAVATINSNSAAIEAAVENTLSRDGTSPNEMNSTLDMNSNRIINLPAAVQGSEPLRLSEALSMFNGGGGGGGGTTYQAGAGLTLTDTTFSIGSGAIANSMLAGNIPASKLVGTDITTIGTLSSGTVPVARVTGLATVATSGSAADLTGTVANARLSGVYSGITGVGTLASGSIPSTLITGLAAIATSGSGSDITTGTIADARLPTTMAGKTLTGATTFTGTVTLNADPVSALQAATKQYCDNAAVGLNVKASVSAATTANIALTGAQTIDGVATGTKRILVKDQSTQADNGIYVAAAGAWARATDMDSWDSEVVGAVVFVSGGTVNGSSSWATNVSTGGTVGSTAMPWSQFSASTSYTAGSGLTLIGSQFSIPSGVVTNAMLAGSIIAANLAGSIPFTKLVGTDITAVGILTPSLEVSGFGQFHTAGTSPDNSFNGQLRTTKPAASGQHINLVRSGNTAWSLGYIYNTDTFAIGTGNTTDSSFTNPQFRMDGSGNVTIAGSVVIPSSKTYSAGSVALGSSGAYGYLTDASGRIALFLGNAGDPGNYYDNTSHFFRDRSSVTQASIAGGNLTTVGSITSGSSVSAPTAVATPLLSLQNSATPVITFTPNSGATKTAGILQSTDILYTQSVGVANWTLLDLNTGALGFGIAPITGTVGVGSGNGTAIGNGPTALLHTNPYVDSNHTTAGLVVKLNDQAASTTFNGTGYETAIVGTILSTHNDGSLQPNKVGVMGSAQGSGTSSGNLWGGYFEAQLDPGSSTTALTQGVEIDMNNYLADKSTDYTYPAYGLTITGAGTTTSTAAILISGPVSQWGQGLVFVNATTPYTKYGIDLAPDPSPSNSFAHAAMRLPNNSTIAWRRASDASNVNCLYLDSNDVFQLGGGLPIGTTGLVALANNAAAIGAGLTVGTFYRTGGNPDLVCVVH